MISVCGRYNFDSDFPDSKLAAIVEMMEKKWPGAYKTGEIFPGDTAPAIIEQNGKIVAVPAVFGFPGFQDGKLLINARSETAAEKRTFSESLEKRRVIFPATGFEEAVGYISSHANGEVRRLEGIINHLHAEKELLVADIDLDKVRQTCEDYDRAFSQETDRKAKTAFIMIGIQGSGKSEFCRRFLPDVERINLDTLETRKNELRAITACHVRGVDYVVDNTNPAREDRARYIPEAKAMGYRVIGYFMQSRLQECIARNNLREGKERIPAKAIAMTSNRLEMPSFDEGFDELYFVANDGSEMIISEWRENDEL